LTATTAQNRLAHDINLKETVMKKPLLVMPIIGIVALGALILANWYPETSVSAHGPGEDSTTVELGNGKVTIHYGTPKLAGRNLDEMIKPGLATSWV
jgi:hypothetical protein